MTTGVLFFYISDFVPRQLRRATSLLWRRQCRQRRYVRIAVRSVDRARRRLEFKPLQQRFILRVIGKPVTRHNTRLCSAVIERWLPLTNREVRQLPT